MIFMDTSYGYHSSRPLRYVASSFTIFHKRLFTKCFTWDEEINDKKEFVDFFFFFLVFLQLNFTLIYPVKSMMTKILLPNESKKQD